MVRRSAASRHRPHARPFGVFARIPLATCSIPSSLARIVWHTKLIERVPHNGWLCRMPEPSRTFQRVILACVLATYLITALYAAHYKYEILIWDDAEYVAHALDTVDQVQAYRVPSWLAFIAIHQHYAKPPLYVNSLALFNLFVGRLRTPLATGLLAAATSALVGLLVLRLIRPLTSFWFAILAMLAVAGLPAVARWAPAAYPDMQLALCVLWVIVILSFQTRARWLGVALGAGLLAKFSFPLFV